MRGLFTLSPRHWIRLALLLAVLLALPVRYGAADGTMVVIDPPGRAVAVGGTTTFNIRIENVTNLFGAEVHLKFDPPTLVQVVDADPATAGVQIQPGTFLAATFTAQNSVDPATGEINFAISQMAPDVPVSGSGVLATITVQGVAAGTATLNFTSVILSDSGGTAISTGTRGGSLTVGPTPTPGGPTATPTLTPTPGPPPTPSPTPTGGVILGYHTVKAGETLFCIGRAYGVDPYAIAARNGIINPNIIRVGQVLAIPNVPRTVVSGRVCPRQFGTGPTPTPPTCRWYHTVVAGENLYRISVRYGVSMWTIAQANHITNLNYIRVGQVLCIP